MNTKKVLVYGLVVVLLVAGLVLPRSKTVVQQVDGNKTTLVGATSGNDIIPCQTIGGFTRCYYTQKINMASTTACAIRPQATSTLVSSLVSVQTGTTTITVWDMAKSANNYAATTTQMGTTFSIGASAIATWMGSSTAVAGVGGLYQFTPNDWFVVKYGGPTAAANASNGLIGYCHEIFELHN